MLSSTLHGRESCISFEALGFISVEEQRAISIGITEAGLWNVVLNKSKTMDNVQIVNN
jgi:hypothetical protein